MNKEHITGKILMLVTVLTLALSMAIGCTGQDNVVSSPSQQSSASAAPAAVDTPTSLISAVEKALPSVTKVEVQFGPQGAPTDPTASAGAGTGWVIDASKGLIVTNDHVVDGAVTVEVVLGDGSRYTAQNVQGNAEKDLAVIKINAQNLTAATLGDSSQLQMGQTVAAIGNALDLGIRVTGGIVCLLDVTITDQNNIQMTGLIETDATLNPGNSGGILINTSGEVVGITSAGLEGSSTDVESFGYAISINEAMPVLNNLISQIP